MSEFSKEINEVNISYQATKSETSKDRVLDNPIVEFVSSTATFACFSIFLASLFSTIDYSSYSSTFVGVKENPFSFDTLLVAVPLFAGYYYFLSEESKSGFSDRRERLRIKELLSGSILLLLLFSVVTQILTNLPATAPEGWMILDDSEREKASLGSGAFGQFKTLLVNFWLTAKYSLSFESFLYLLGVSVGLEILRLSGGALSRSPEGKRDSLETLKLRVVDLNRSVADLFRHRLPGDSLRLALHATFESSTRKKHRWLLAVHFISRFIANFLLCVVMLLIANRIRGEEGYALILLPIAISLLILPSVECWFVKDSKVGASFWAAIGIFLLGLGIYGLWMGRDYILLVTCLLLPLIFWSFQAFFAGRLTWGSSAGNLDGEQKVTAVGQDSQLSSSDFRFATGAKNKTKWRSYNYEQGRLNLLWRLFCFNGRMGHWGAARLDQLLKHRQDAVNRIRELEELLVTEMDAKSSGVSYRGKGANDDKAPRAVEE